MKQSNGKAVGFMKKNAVYFILALCVVAIGIAATMMLVKDDGINNTVKNPDNVADTGNPTVPDIVEPDPPTVNPDNEDETPVDSIITFIMPVENSTKISRYSEQMVFNTTLKRYSAHLATDFFADEGTDVLAVYDGTVKKIENSLLKGYVITIDHGNGLETVYGSLADGDAVAEGQKVKKGDVIGQVSVTNRQEYRDGAHLHFEVTEDGKVIDPIKYLSFDEK